MYGRHSFPYDTAEFTYEPGAFRAVAETELGSAIWDFLTQPHIIHALVVAVRVGAAPAAAISVDLLLAFGDGDGQRTAREQLARGLDERFPREPTPSLDQVKRMTGHMIRQILGTVGAEVRTKNSPANDRTGLFTTSARYRWEAGEGGA